MYHLAFLQNLSSWELIIIFLVVLLFFGAKRLPGLAKSLENPYANLKMQRLGLRMIYGMLWRLMTNLLVHLLSQ